MIRPIATRLAIAAMLLGTTSRSNLPAADIFGARFCLPGRGSTPAPSRTPDRDCPNACHAVCARGTRPECDEDHPTE